MTFIFRNRTIFWDIPKWNRGQTKWDGGSILLRYFQFQFSVSAKISSIQMNPLSSLFWHISLLLTYVHTQFPKKPFLKNIPKKQKKIFFSCNSRILSCSCNNSMSEWNFCAPFVIKVVPINLLHGTHLIIGLLH